MKQGNMTIAPTAGKWNYKKSGFEITIGTEKTGNVKGEHDYTVCKIEDNSFQAQANAKIIAAAPELLEALKTILENFETNLRFNQTVSMVEIEAGKRIIEQAIKKATE